MTGSHEVRGSIPLGSTIIFNNLGPPIEWPFVVLCAYSVLVSLGSEVFSGFQCVGKALFPTSPQRLAAWTAGRERRCPTSKRCLRAPVARKQPLDSLHPP